MKLAHTHISYTESHYNGLTRSVIPPKPTWQYIYITNALLSFNYFFKSTSHMTALSMLAGRFADMPVLSKLLINRSSQARNAFKNVIIKRWFMTIKCSTMANKHSTMANKCLIATFKHSITTFKRSIMANKHLIMAFKRWFMTNVHSNVAYADLFAMYRKALITTASLNNTYIINNNSLLFTNYLKQ